MARLWAVVHQTHWKEASVTHWHRGHHIGATTLLCQPASSFMLSPRSQILPATLLCPVGVTWRNQGLWPAVPSPDVSERWALLMFRSRGTNQVHLLSMPLT